ncbi:MAG: hypothetical protein AB9907_03105 [Flexilinea sp.]|jgi:VIT1/CCC1 family predicted Fe2+/Mn2+ transporter
MANVQNAMLITGIALLVIGGISLISGIVILISKVFSKDIKEIQEQAAKLAAKGVTDDISGALGNASFLVKELNAMIETGRGIGVVLICTGALLIIGGVIVLTRLI